MTDGVHWLHAVIDAPDALRASTAQFWSRVLGWRVGSPWPGHPELRSFEPADGDAYVHLQEVGGPPRVHLDLESDDPSGRIAAAVGAGAMLVATHDRWTSMRSPGGLPFCVLPARAHRPPQPVTWPGGHRSRLVQVCIDSPVAVHDDEVAFWRALLGGRWVDSAAGQFAGKWHDDAGSPLQLLFQRLEEPLGDVRAHFDLGTDDVDAEVRRLVEVGAADVRRDVGGWHVLTDPAGLPLCVTGNAPDQTPHRDLD